MSFKHLLVSLALFLSACVSQAQVIGGGVTVGNFLANDGTALNPSYSFLSKQSTGFFVDGATVGIWSQIGSPTVAFGTSVGIVASASRGFNWYTAVGTGSYAQQQGISFMSTNTIGVQAGGSVATAAAIGGILTLDSTSTSNVGAGQENLKTYTLPANVLSANGKMVKVTALFQVANNANAKNLGMQWCGGGLLYGLTAGQLGAGKIETWLVRTGSNAQLGWVSIMEGLSSSPVGTSKSATSVPSVRACTDSGTISLQVVGQGVAASDITVSLFYVEMVN